MTIEITCEQQGIRVTARIITDTLETHSAFQEIPKEKIEKIQERIWLELHDLTLLALKYRKP